MTTNQVAYWANQETARANRVKEAETRRHNEETEVAASIQAKAAQDKAVADNRKALAAMQKVPSEVELNEAKTSESKTKALGNLISAGTNVLNTMSSATAGLGQILTLLV